MDKPKILIRYMGGGGGSFLCIVLANLYRVVPMTQFFSGHDDVGSCTTKYHNLHDVLFRPEVMLKLNTFNTVDSDLVSMLQGQLEFYPTPWPYYVTHSHLIRTDVIAQILPQTRLVAIKFTEQDRDQVAYNWVRKFLVRFRHRAVLASKIATVQRELNRLHSVTVDQFGNFDNEQDLRLLTWIMKYAGQDFFQQFNSYQPSQPEINIDFRSLYDGSLADHVKDLACALEIPYNSERQLRTRQLIRRYAENQQPVPWKLTLEDYE